MQDEFVDAIYHYIQSMLPGPAVCWAQWLAAEDVDPDLSRIQMRDGSTVGGVPKCAGAAALAPGDRIICFGDGKTIPLIIIDKVVGDISLYRTS